MRETQQLKGKKTRTDRQVRVLKVFERGTTKQEKGHKTISDTKKTKKHKNQKPRNEMK